MRGIFNTSQTPLDIYRLAEATAFASGRGTYAVGWDGRKASSLLARTVMSGVAAVGSDVSVLGLVPTPVVAFGTRTHSCAAGFSVTASHNPREYSGVKIFDATGMELPKSHEERIERAMGIDVVMSSGKFGVVRDDRCVVDEYIDAMVSRYGKASGSLRIAIDCANGPGGLVTPVVLTRLGHRVLALNAQVSWWFPARPPEPTAAHLSDFTRVVPALGVDFALAHDGDADRLVLIDGTGAVLPDAVLASLVLRGLGVSAGAAVISENSSNAVAEEAERIGLRVVRSKVGKSFAMIASERGVFACEPSKIVDPKWGLWEDGINAAALVSAVLSSDRGLLSQIVREIEWKYRQVNVDVAVRMQPLMVNAKEAFKRLGIAEERTLDGYKLVLEDDSWVMFRPSGTEPKTRLYCESKDEHRLAQLVQLGVQCIESSL